MTTFPTERRGGPSRASIPKGQSSIMRRRRRRTPPTTTVVVLPSLLFLLFATAVPFSVADGRVVGSVEVAFAAPPPPFPSRRRRCFRFDVPFAGEERRRSPPSRRRGDGRIDGSEAIAAAASSIDDDGGKSEGRAAEEEGPFKQLKIAFVTGNEMKAKEVNLILADEGATKGPSPGTSMVDLRVLNVDLPEIQEVNTEAIAKAKAVLGSQLAGGPCVVEDTSLEFSALGGMPGPYIKWFQNTLRSDGLHKILYAYDDKSATAVCTLAFCPYPHADPVLFTGTTTGTIVEPVEGRGFGWDSIFVPDGEDEPFSCMPTERKNSLSHRGRAVRKWAQWLGRNQDELWERQGGKPAVGHKGLDFKTTYAEE